MCDCNEARRLGMKAMVRVQMINEPYCFWSGSNAYPQVTTCAHCDRVLGGIDYGLALEAIYPQDLGIHGEYFFDLPAVAPYVALRVVGRFRPDGIKRPVRTPAMPTKGTVFAAK